MKRISSRMAAVAAIAVLAAATVATVAVAGGTDDTKAPTKKTSKNIVETAVGAGDFDTLVSLVQKAGLAQTLAEGGPFTVFAPTDAAFDRVPKETLDSLAANPEQLKAVLLYHVAEGKLRASRVVKRSRIKTLNGASVRVKVKKNGRSVRVNDAKVVKVNVGASNGVIHVINRVLLPPKS